MDAPQIIEPFSLLGDTVKGDTPDEVALNLAGCTQVSLTFNCKMMRRAPDLRQVFRGCKLSDEAKKALRWVDEIYRKTKQPKE